MLTDQNIEAELSYAYLHAVARKPGSPANTAIGTSTEAGVDATITRTGGAGHDRS